MSRKPRFDKRKLWPWRDWMTIGIGLLATEKGSGPGPNHVVLVADTMGSYDDYFSHKELHKTFVYDDLELYATAADDVGQAALLISMVHDALAVVPKNERSTGDFIRCVAQSLFMFRMETFNLTILPKYGVPPGTIAPHSQIKASSLMQVLLNTPSSVHEKLQHEWEQMGLGCDMLLANFDKNGQATLLYVPGDQMTFKMVTFPGFCAIGCGAENALFWLSHRGHTLGMNLKRAAYHGYEAKLMAESSAHVNEHIDIVIATKGKSWFISSHRPETTDAPFTLDNLKEWHKKYAPAPTDDL